MQRLYSACEPVDVDGVIRDHDVFPWCGDVEIISTPGHTPGHINSNSLSSLNRSKPEIRLGKVYIAS